MNKSNTKNNLPLIFLVISGVLIVGGIFIAAFFSPKNEGITKALIILISIVTIALGAVCIYFAATFFSFTKEEPNFFLYETKAEANMPVDNLTFDHVNKKMTYFMSKIAGSAKEMWMSDIIGSDNDYFGEDDIFRPLAAYKMIYDLADRGNEAIWNLYLNANDDIMVSIADALAESGDNELGKVFRQLHKTAGGNYAKTETFINNNKTYIQKKMMKYIKTNIEKF